MAAQPQPQPQSQSQAQPQALSPGPTRPAAESLPVNPPAAVPAAPASATSAATEPELAGPQGKVAVVSSYPVDVFWKGKLVGKGPSPQVSLPVGRQMVTLVSSAYFLRANLPVNVRAEAPSGLEAPRLGRVSIKARPDNCQVFIDGTFVDYPPILDRAVAVGTHTVAFKWPDGTRREETALVEGTSPVYVMGRKD